LCCLRYCRIVTLLGGWVTFLAVRLSCNWSTHCSNCLVSRMSIVPWQTQWNPSTPSWEFAEYSSDVMAIILLFE
jgi:hypothetical protein